MKTVGIICEYNPFHLGHQKQIDRIRAEFGQDAVIVCLMSGNFVQRGMPAIFDKSLRAKAAIDCGADLVLELPVTYALSSAEGFAAGGVKILSPICDYLCFGCETGNADTLMHTAELLLSPVFSSALKQELEYGCSFPVARQRALQQLSDNSSLLENPNDILAVEYCKAILAQGCTMKPFPIRREGGYHDDNPDTQNPSATSLRQLIMESKSLDSYIPAAAQECFQNAPVHTLAAGERAILARLRTMSDRDYEGLPYGSEGLWRKLMHSSRSCATLEDILTSTKSKRYTRTRLDRMVMCAYLGITDEQMHSPAPYVRVLGLRHTGIPALKKTRETGLFPHIGEKTGLDYEKLEQQWDDLYGLFSVNTPSSSGQTGSRRIYLHQE